jgi:hypothetical protein
MATNLDVDKWDRDCKDEHKSYIGDTEGPGKFDIPFGTYIDRSPRCNSQKIESRPQTVRRRLWWKRRKQDASRKQEIKNGGKP